MSFEYVKHVMVDGTDNPYPGGVADYERQVRQILDNVRTTATGRSVLSFFALRSKIVWIVSPPDNQSRINEGAQAANGQAAIRRGFEMRSGLDGHVVSPGRRGTGAGSDSLLHFQPEHWTASADSTTTPEEVMVHELFHAMRQTFGALRSTPMGGDFFTVEELYSIFVENMYATERGLPLRATHKAASSMVSPDHTMAHNPSFHAPMRDLAAMMPHVVNTLARVPTAYNPLRDWKEFSARPR